MCGLVFIPYAAYIVSEYLTPTGPAFTARRSAASLGNALCGLVVIGLPALVYAIRSPRTLVPFELRFATEALPVEEGGGPEGAAPDHWLADRLASRLAAAGWTVEGPYDDQGTWTLLLECDGVETVLGTDVQHELIEDECLNFWHVWLRRDDRTAWRWDPLATLVEATCGELALGAHT
jgi:hypothetical protein